MIVNGILFNKTRYHLYKKHCLENEGGSLVWLQRFEYRI